MRTSAFLPALLIAASASAQSSINMSITPADGGTRSTFSWSITGSLITTGVIYYEVIEPRTDFNPTGQPGEILPWTSSELDGNPYTITGLSTGLYVHALTDTGVAYTDIEYTTFEMERYFAGGPYVIRLRTSTGTNANLIDTEGTDLIGFIGATNGSITFDKPFSFFNEGTWITDFGGEGRTTTLTITPIPEPSTYGLILGGLALAGAAIRRRRKVA